MDIKEDAVTKRERSPRKEMQPYSSRPGNHIGRIVGKQTGAKWTLWKHPLGVNPDINRATYSGSFIGVSTHPQLEAVIPYHRIDSQRFHPGDKIFFYKNGIFVNHMFEYPMNVDSTQFKIRVDSEMPKIKVNSVWEKLLRNIVNQNARSPSWISKVYGLMISREFNEDNILLIWLNDEVNLDPKPFAPIVEFLEGLVPMNKGYAMTPVGKQPVPQIGLRCPTCGLRFSAWDCT